MPVGFRYNPEEDAIEIGGHSGFAKRKKYRDVVHNPRFAFVIDDVPSVNPRTVRGIEIRGITSADPLKGKESDSVSRDGEKGHKRSGIGRPNSWSVISWGFSKCSVLEEEDERHEPRLGIVH